MKVRNIELTLLKIEHKAGTGKTSGKPYSFFAATVIDEDSNVFALNLSDTVSSALGERAKELRNVPVKADVEFKPKGFDIGGTIVALTPEGEAA